jgi:translation initiation factor IF-1
VAKSDVIQLDGQVEEVLPNAMFRVIVNETHKILTVISDRMHQNRIQILTGDKVTIEMSPYDLTRGRIVYRK